MTGRIVNTSRTTNHIRTVHVGITIAARDEARSGPGTGRSSGTQTRAGRFIVAVSVSPVSPASSGICRHLRPLLDGELAVGNRIGSSEALLRPDAVVVMLAAPFSIDYTVSFGPSSSSA